MKKKVMKSSEEYHRSVISCKPSDCPKYYNIEEAGKIEKSIAKAKFESPKINRI